MSSVITYINLAPAMTGLPSYNLPSATIQVGGTAGFPTPSGSFTVESSAGLQTISYTGTSGGTLFTGCTGGTGAVEYQAAVTYYHLAQTITTGTTTFTGAGGLTINAVSTAGFPSTGSNLVFNNNIIVQYTGSTTTSFTGCYTANTGFGPLGTYPAGTGLYTFLNTTVTGGSVALPTSSITVVSTVGFPSSGIINVLSTNGLQSIYYSGTSGGNTFTGCQGGTGTINSSSTVGAFASTLTTNATASPITTINVVSTAGFGNTGTLTFNDNLTVTYTGITATSFTGCSGGNVFSAGTTLVVDQLGMPATVGINSPSDPPIHNDANNGQANSFGSFATPLTSELIGEVNLGQNNSWGFNDLSGKLVNDPLYNSSTDYDPIGKVNYKMRGFYVTGQVYESWIVQGRPSNMPPSGHTLINIIIEEIF